MEFIVLAFALLLNTAQQPQLLAHFTSMEACHAQATKMSKEYEEVLKMQASDGAAFICLKAIPATI